MARIAIVGGALQGMEAVLLSKAAGYETDGIATPVLQELMYSANAPRRAGAGATPSPTAVPAPEQGGSDAQETPAPGQEG